MNFKSSVVNFLKLILTCTPFYILFGFFVLWSYLDSIDRLDVFMEVIDSKLASITLLVSFLLLSIGFVSILYFPSLGIVQLSVFLGENSFRRTLSSTRIKFIPFVSIAVSLLSIISLCVVSFYAHIPDGLKRYFFISSFACAWCISFMAIQFLSVKRKKELHFMRNGKIVKYKYFLTHKLIMSFFIAFSALSVALPLLMLIKLSSVKTFAGFATFLFVMLVIIAMSFFPSMLFYSNSLLTKSFKHLLTYIVLPTFFLFFMLMLIIPNLFGIISIGALKGVGVIDKQPHIFRMDNDRYPSYLFPKAVWEHVIINPREEGLFVKGTIFFSLGKQVILCPNFVVKIRDKYMKYDFDNIWNSKDELHVAYFKKAMGSCVLINRESITQWDGIVDGTNILNL